MALKLKVEYAGVVCRVMDRLARLGRNQCGLEWCNEGDPSKVEVAVRLCAETTVTVE